MTQEGNSFSVPDSHFDSGIVNLKEGMLFESSIDKYFDNLNSFCLPFLFKFEGSCQY